jgi:hypothetical protein
VCI